MGSFANAISIMMGPKTAQELLDTWIPSHFSSTDRWTKFQEHAIQIIGSKEGRVGFKKLTEKFHLETNDSMPILIQLQGNDGSETHAITVYNNKIYDSASRYVLKKTQESLEWCCGQYGFKQTLRSYMLTVAKKNPAKKRSRH
jgi:hypothetical protein